MWNLAPTRRTLFLALTCLCVTGCAGVRVPAIDQTGTRIFAPTTTTTVFPGCGSPCGLTGCCGSFLPEPAFAEPPAVPACPEGPIGPAIGTGVATCPPACPQPTAPPAPRQDRLVLSPTKMVAPIGTEVVLLGGICGPRGYYVTKQPMEWTLSQESVGNIIAINEPDHPHMARLLKKSSQKMSSNFAITRTSTKARMLDRGTAKESDDVWLKKGQSWITVSSPTEGISYITAVAPGAENWDQRRRTAEVHWVDAQWALPGPAVVRAGERHLLTTTVKRASSGRGAKDWLVRYEIVSGPDAVFSANGQRTIEVQTDSEGRANAEISPRVVTPGSTQVRIDVLTPRDAAASADNVPVGNGFTTITWSAPGLQVRTSGPATVAVGTAISYVVEVTNPGDLPADNAVVRASIPVLMRFLSSTPPPSQELTRDLLWQLGRLSPRETRQFEIRCSADGAGEQRLQVRAEAAGGLSAESSVATRVVQSSLAVRVLDPPTTAKVGERVHFNIEVINDGDQPVSNVIIRDQFDAGLRHTGGERSPIERSLGNLMPRDIRQIGVSFIVQRPGQHCHTVEVLAAGGHAASRRVCIEAVEPVQDVTLSVTGPEQRVAGEAAIYEITVTNTGEAELTSVQLLAVPDTSLTPTSASPNMRSTREGLVWDIPSLPPGQQATRLIQCRCEPPSPRAEMAVRVTTGQGITAADTAFTTISPAPGQPPENAPPRIDAPPAAPAAGVSGELKVSMAETEDPIAVGRSTRYIIELENDRNVEDRNVEVTFHIPPGLEFDRFVSISAGLSISISDDKRTVEVERIAEMRPGGKRMFRVEVIGQQAGNWPFRVEVRSLRTTEPIGVIEETLVNEN